MIKIKTLKGAYKRFKKTASGRYKYKHAHARHILTKKSTKRKRFLRKKSLLPNIYRNTLYRYLPYI